MSFSIGARLKRLVEEFAPNFDVEEHLSDAELRCFFSIKSFLEAKAGWCDMVPGESEDNRSVESASEEVMEAESGRTERIPIEERRSVFSRSKDVLLLPRAAEPGENAQLRCMKKFKLSKAQFNAMKRHSQEGDGESVKTRKIKVAVQVKLKKVQRMIMLGTANVFFPQKG